MLRTTREEDRLRDQEGEGEVTERCGPDSYWRWVGGGLFFFARI